jgi:serine/threonine-protein kinase
MGSVFKAHDPVIGRNVAIKIVRIEEHSDQERAASIARFRAEVQAAGRCSHPAIVSIYDFLEQSGQPAIVMELVEGSSLYSALRDPAQLAALPMPDTILQVLDGLGYAHRQSIVHRDIKPANILLTASGQVKIADFGIASRSDGNTAEGGAMVGTPSYMAPEQLTDDGVDRRADLFSVGAILYEMLAGRPPFAGRTVNETILRLSDPDPADLTPISAAAPSYVAVLRQALSKDRTRRFQTADAFAAALQTVPAQIQDPQATIVMAPRRTSSSLDPGLLAQAERQLAQFVGPIARAMVARAAHTAATPDAMRAALAREVPDAATRSRFLRAFGGGRVEPSLGGRSREGQTMAPVTASGPRTQTPLAGPVTPQAAAAAQAALTEYLGPIARVLVRDAAAKASSAGDFIERLCAHVDKPEVRSKLYRRLRTEIV